MIMVLWGVYGVFMVYFITFVYSFMIYEYMVLCTMTSVPTQKNFRLMGFLMIFLQDEIFMGFSMFYQILEANGI